MKNCSKLVHIGLAKSLSSTLQAHWQISDNYVAIDPNGVTTKTDSFFDQHRENIDGLVAQLEGSPPPFSFEPGHKLQVLSGEGLASSWFCHMPELSEHIPKRQRLLATMFGPLADKVLIIIRNPVDWIRSAHSQLLKEGGFLGLADYMQEFRVSIEKNLDLRALVTFWQQYDAEVVILPMELFKEDEDAFWIAYEGMLQMSRPESSRLQKIVVNPRVYEALEIHQSVNRILHILETACVENKEFPVVDGVIEGLNAARVLGSRSAMERLRSDQILELEGLLSPRKEQGKLEIPTELAQQLQNNFVDFLGQTKSFSFQQILEGYQHSVSPSYVGPTH